MTMKMMAKDQRTLERLKFSILFLVLFLMSSPFLGCDSGLKVIRTGVFLDSPVAGLTYATAAIKGKTSSKGEFAYYEGETVTFSIGDLVLGSVPADKQVTPITLVEGAADAADQRVNNICVLLQTLDEDGDLNNGIKITSAVTAVVSGYAEKIDFGQTTAAFAADANVAALLAELNAAEPAIFTDKDPRPRALRPATAAREHFQRSLSLRNEVRTYYGKLSGFEADKNTWAYYGIPYAKPPVGSLRWKPPVAPDAWWGVRDAVAWSDQAAQNPAYQSYGEGGMSEDCLYLNVTAPKNAKNLPVMVWFHGGAFMILTNNAKSYNNPASLPTKGVVLVTVNHRLGPFGYLAHPLLSKESSYGGSGNYGQMDLIAALKWVKYNIAAFGGNPDNVTIFGQSGGGGKSISLQASPLAKGLFHKIICQSGMAPIDTNALNAITLEKAEAIGMDLAQRLGVTTLEEMRAVPWTEIVASDNATYPGSITVYGPNVDGYYAPETLSEALKKELPGDVPLMAGANSADLVVGMNLAPGVPSQMPLRSDNNKSPQYVYHFSHVPAGWKALGVKSYHGIELVYSFNYPSSFISHQMMGLTGIPMADISDLNGNGVPGDPADIMISTGYGAADAVLTDTMMTLWTNFAKTGDPSIAGAVEWPAYTTANDTFLEISDTIEVKTGLAAAFQ